MNGDEAKVLSLDGKVHVLQGKQCAKIDEPGPDPDQETPICMICHQGKHVKDVTAQPKTITIKETIPLVNLVEDHSHLVKNSVLTIII